MKYTQKLEIAINQLKRVHRDMNDCANRFILKDAIDQLQEQVKNNSSISNIRLSLPDTKEVNEAAESFGDLYSLDGQFAKGCESGWKAGAEWMRDKVNEQLGNDVMHCSSCDHEWVKPIINAENKKCFKCGVWEETKKN